MKNRNPKKRRRAAPAKLATIESLISKYLAGAKKELGHRLKIWPISVGRSCQSEVTSGLLHHQYSLAVHLAMAPQCWTPHFAPIILRCMIETYIWLAWILQKPEERSKLYVEDGLGREKLIIKHRSDELELEHLKIDDDPSIHASMLWLEDQRYSFLVDINLSSNWSGLDTRKMAEEAGCRDFYRFTYPIFSSVVHSAWNHISKFNLIRCKNVLHGDHRIARLNLLPPQAAYFELAAKYLAKTFRLVDQKLTLKVKVPCTHQRLFRPARPRKT